MVILASTLLFTMNSLFTPLEVIGWSAFILLFLFLLSLPGKRYSLALAAFVTVFIIIGYFISDLSDHTAMDILLRAFAILVVWTVAYLVLRYKKAADEGKKQKDRLNAIFENAQEGMIVTDSQGAIVMANEQTESLFGYTRAELIGNKVEILVPNASREKHVAMRDRFIQSPANRAMGQSLELSAQKKDGTTFPVEVSLGNFTIGEEKFAIAFVVDISQRKNAETNLRLEKSFTQLYFDIAPIIFLVLDNTGKVKSVNKFACNVLGYKENELRGQNWIDKIIPEEEKHEIGDVFNQMIRGVRIGTHENHILTKDGRNILVRWKNEIIYDENNNPIGTLSAGEDVTDLRKQEQTIIDNLEKIKELNEQLEQRVQERTAALEDTLSKLEEANKFLQTEITQRKAIEEKLENNQKLYHIMAHNFPNGVIGILNRNLNYILVDGSELKNLGLSQEALMGQRIFDDLYPIVSASSEQYLRRAFAGENVDFEVNLKEKPYHISVVPIPDVKNNINEILVVIRNVADVKKIEEDLRKNLEKEKELSELKSRFVTMASHEFRTPLSTIMSSIFLLEKYTGDELNEKKEKHLNRIKQTVHNLTEVLNDFLSLGKLEEGKIRMNAEEVFIDELVDNVLRGMSDVKKPGQQIEYKHTGNSQIIVDKMLFRNIVINLVYNAIKYSPNDTRIEIQTNTKDSDFSFTVRDEGIGIPLEDQPHIFKRFYRANNAGEVQGTGLGLHLVKKYSELLHGKIEFESQLGVGTMFKITFQQQPSKGNRKSKYKLQTQ